MKIRSLSLRNVRPHYTDQVTLDLSALRGPIVAVVGPNGAGKSVFLGSLFAALYREWPGGGSLPDLALGRDTFVRAAFDTARGAFTVTQFVDAVTGKGESSVLDGAGAALLTSGKVTEYDAWCERSLPPARVLLASTFGAQGRAGLLDPDLTAQDRRLVLFRALGLDRYEPLPARFRERAASDRARGLSLDAQINSVRTRADTASAEAARAAAVAARDLALAALTAAEHAHAEAVERHAVLVAAWRDAEAARERHGKAAAAVREADARVAALRARLEATARVLADAAAVREAVEHAPRLDADAHAADAALAAGRLRTQETRAELAAALERLATAERDSRVGDPARASLRELDARAEATRAALRDAADVAAAVERANALDSEIRAATDALDAAVREASAARQAAAAADQAIRDAASRVAQAGRSVAEAENETFDLDAARHAAGSLDRLRADLADAEAAVARADAEAENLRSATMDVAGRRIDGLRASLLGIAHATDATTERLCGAASHALATDDGIARQAAEAPARLDSVLSLGRLARDRVAQLRPVVDRAAAMASRLADIERWSVRLTTARAALDEATGAHNAAAEAATSARTARDATAAVEARARDALAGLRDERGAVAKVAARAEEIAALRATAAEIQTQRAAVVRAVEEAESVEASARDAVLAASAHVSRLRADLDAQRDALAAQEATLIRAREALTAARRLAERAGEVAAAEATAAELRTQIGDAEAAAAAARDALAAAPLPPDAQPVPDVEAEERAVRAAAEALRRADGAVAVAERVVADARAAAEQIASLELERRSADELVSDWTRLEADVKAVLQLSIDAAGPELAALTNDLLRGGFGDRYTVTVETQRISADGKRQIEDCYVGIVDTQNGYAGPASGLSGGQVVIVGTALRCALARIGARTAGIERPTLVLDESGAALEEHLVPAWIAMLRHAADVTGAEHILVVTHNPAVRDLADSVVRVANGRIEVES